MKSKPYYFEIKNLITQFMSAFNDIAIKRYDKDRNDSGESVGVGFMYAPKQRVIEDLLNKSAAVALPVISVSISGVSRDTERVFNKIEGSYISTVRSADTIRKIPQPVPVNITINMSIIARYQSDIEQIISNFVPYCDPYISVSWKLPTTEGTSYEREIRTIIEWSGTLNMQYPIELNANQLARVTCDTTFTIKGWLFKQIDSSYLDILKIKSSFASSLLGEECIVFNNLTDPAGYDTGPSVEVFTLDGRPTITYINTPIYYINKTPANHSFIIHGHNFSRITNLYLKTIGSLVFDPVSTYNPFVDTNLITTYPKFRGQEVTNFIIESNNSVSFQLPLPISIAGRFDIIAVNRAGYGILSEDSIISGVPDSFQPPYIHGVAVNTI